MRACLKNKRRLRRKTFSDESRLHHAWFSKQQAKLVGTVFYKTPHAGLIEVTCVSSGPNSGCSWPDMTYLGVVSDFASRGNHGSLNFEGLFRSATRFQTYS